MNFAVLASGNGSNLQAILDALRQGRISGELRLVFSDKPGAPALARARAAGVKVVVARRPADYPSREAFDSELVAILTREDIRLVVLAGYMRILSPVVIRAFPDRIINIHPALLPAFKGAHAVKDALAAGVATTGVTVHFVDEEVDHGAVIAQAEVKVAPGDTLETLLPRIHEAEHALYPKVVDLFLRGEIRAPGP